MKSTFLLLIISAIAFNGTSQNNIEFSSFDLKNGLHVILHENHSSPIVAVTVMYHVGSKNEDPSRTGMAHFFEHLLFEGSDNIKRGEYTRYVENAGGILNADTTNDRTFYYELLPSNQLELGLWLESERMMHANIDSIGIATQREVVKEEKRMRYDNAPYGHLLSETMKRAFKEHPYQWTTIGSMEHLDAATESDFIDFYNHFYVPNNAVLSIAGDFDSIELKKQIEAYFGPIPRGEKPIYRPTIVEPIQTKQIKDTVYGKDQLPLVLFAYHIPPMGSEDFYAVDMVNTLLSKGESSRLNKSLVEEQQVAMYSGAFSFPLEDPGLTLSFGLANIGVDPLQLEEAMTAEFEKVKTDLLTDKEFQKLRNQMESDFITSNSKMVGVAESLANYHMYYGDSNLINTELERYNKVTKEALMEAAKKYYSKENRVIIYFLQEPTVKITDP